MLENKDINSYIYLNKIAGVPHELWKWKYIIGWGDSFVSGTIESLDEFDTQKECIDAIENYCKLNDINITLLYDITNVNISLIFLGMKDYKNMKLIKTYPFEYDKI